MQTIDRTVLVAKPVLKILLMPLMTLCILFALNYSLSLQSCVCNKTIMFEQHENMYYTWNIQSVSILQFFMFQDLYRNKQFLNKKRIKLQSDIELNRKFAVEINGYHKNATKNKIIQTFLNKLQSSYSTFALNLITAIFGSSKYCICSIVKLTFC